MRGLTLFDADALHQPPPAEPEPSAGSRPHAAIEAPERTFTAAQDAAIAQREHSLALSASAGSGKTSVLVERFVRAVLDDGADPAAILAITFTDKAAGELRERVRARFLELGAREQAAATETAFISTIHGFCARLLRAHPLAAGLDPGFAVLDEPRAARLRGDAANAALRRLLADGGGEALDLVAAYGPDPLATMIRGVHDELRSQGDAEPRLPAVAPQPPPDAERAALHAAHARFAIELAEAEAGTRVDAARDALEQCAALLEDLEEGIVPWPGRLKALTVICGSATALRTDACTAYVEAREAFSQACADHHAARHVALIDELLRHYGAAYARRKAALGVVDFDDLELAARDLLRDQPAVRAAWRERFALLMVDEFQDTNRRQLEILEALERDDLFSVGDAQQSIYAFRHADVRIFAARREALAPRGLALELAESFRSAPGILSALNTAFAPSAATPGDVVAHVPLHPGRPAEEFALPGDVPAVELLLTGAAGWDAEDAPDIGATLPPAPAWRHAEARLLARRLRELVDAGEDPGDMAVLVRASASMPVVERALSDAGLVAVATAGRGFWSRQEVVDLVGYAAVLANPLDERALLAVLGSPLCGAGADGLALLSLAARARGRDLWWHLRAVLVDGEHEETGLEALDPADRARLTAFATHVAAERARPGRHALDALLERVIAGAGYDVHLLGLHGGERRLANVGKLLGMARDHEAAEGRDLRGFVDHAAALEAAQRREPEAPVDDPDGDAIRLMTIHAAKGLEFGTVVVADLGRKANIGVAPLLVDGDRVGLRLTLLDGGEATSALDYEALKAARRAAQAAEERRVLYVALTRAKRRLILSGAIEHWRDSASAPALTWLGPALIPDIAERLEQATQETARTVSFHEGATVALTLNTPATRLELGIPGPATAAAPAADDDHTASPDLPATARTPARAPEAAPFGGALSYTALSTWAKCGYRFYAQRVLGLPERAAPPGLAPLTATTPVAPNSPAPTLDPRVRGIVLHALIEELDLAAPRAAEPARIAALADAEGATTSAADHADVAALLHAFAGHPLRARLAAASRLRREHEFALELRPGDPSSPLLTGIVDALAVEPDGTWVIADWKTDRLEHGADPEALTARDYGVQRALYALAALRAGAARVEVVHLFLEAPDRPATATFTPDDEPALVTVIAALADPLRAGEHPLTDRPHAALCATCPARGTLCPYPPELTLRPEAAPISAPPVVG